ncbi:hypothetical protein [Frigoribacterium sp. Leaf44]|uniref:hypothetical protein n=1 Tax=Frigoribacterium sp. Leaf44 TaxID=1736220 RepID=UPI0006F59789|nr:hypothetical protein [Frigoribacterium sp. Leaf44]KQN45612.1 hypothetical protein ASE87_03355 [Frigoribacterium sp. Leaf44]
MKKFVATALLVVVGLFAVPTAASAYAPSTDVTVSGRVVAGQPVAVGFASGTFTPGETVSIAVTGEGRVTLAAIETVTITKAATASGAASVTVTLPANARGTYSLTATGVSSGSLATSALTVVAADAGSAAVGGNDGLAFTGSTVPTLVIWGAAGAVLLGIALMVVLTLQRRARSNA